MTFAGHTAAFGRVSCPGWLLRALASLGLHMASRRSLHAVETPSSRGTGWSPGFLSPSTHGAPARHFHSPPDHGLEVVT